MIKSLKVRLLIGQLLLLAFVVSAFASVVYLQMQRLTFADVDGELLVYARLVESELQAPAPPRRPGDRPGDRPDWGPMRDDGSRPMQAANPRRDERNSPRPGPPRDRPAGPVPPWDLPSDLPPDLLQRLSEPLGRRPPGFEPYFVLFNADDERLAGSPNAPDTLWRQPPPGRNRSYDFQMDGPRREIMLQGPRQTRILVGSDVSPQLDALQRLAVMLWLVGGAVLLAGGFAGWLLTGRAIAPIRQMSALARSISASNLSRRMDTQTMDLEFGQLSELFNSMLDRLQTAFQQQSRFVADASHELRTPLSVLIMNAELALSRDRTPDEYRTALATCLRASQRMKALTEDLLMLAKSDSGQIPLNKSSLDLDELVADSIEILQPLANQQDVQIQHRRQPVPILGDRNRLRQLIDNLIKNAIVYNHPGGTVTVEVTRKGERAILRVGDTGPGIAAVDLPHVFDRFYRIDTARSRDQGGSGLGLSICKSIADQHEGLLTVASEPGVGSTFEFSVACPDASDAGAPLSS